MGSSSLSPRVSFNPGHGDWISEIRLRKLSLPNSIKGSLVRFYEGKVLAAISSSLWLTCQLLLSLIILCCSQCFFAEKSKHEVNATYLIIQH